MRELTAILETCRGLKGPAALATIVRTEGSSYRRAGAHMLVLENGETIGSVSGGCLERDVIENAQRICTTGEAKVLSYDTSGEEEAIFGSGLGCKGLIEILVEPIEQGREYLRYIERIFSERASGVVATTFTGGKVQRAFGIEDEEALRTGRSYTKEATFFEVIQAPVQLLIFGAGFDAIPMCRLAKEVGFEVTVVDRRPAYASRERFPEATDIVIATPKELPTIHPRAVAVIMSHNYISDRDFLRALLPIELRYLGLMGPRRRAEKMLEEFRADGFLVREEWLRKLHNPVGLDIGAEGPEQIALAILAEIQTALAGHTGGMLREKKGPIHSPRAANL